MNTLKSPVGKVRADLVDALKSLPQQPAISTLPELPELLMMGNLRTNDENSDVHRDEGRKEVVVDAICGAAVLRGAHIFAPGVLAMQTNTQIGERVNVHADLSGACRKGFSGVFESDRKLFLGVGLARMQRFQLYGSEPSSGVAVEMVRTISGVPSIGDGFLGSGEGLLQNFPSMVCARVLDPRKGDVVLDMCAAPGHKTTHLAQLMDNQGKIFALDKSERRAGLLRRNLTEFNVLNAEVFTCDASKCVREETATADGQPRPPFSPNMFDKVLLDAPCSGTGNRPQLSNALTEKLASSYPHVQRRLLAAAVELLKPGGTLVYSTCSIFASENEDNVAWLLNKFQNRLQVVDAEPRFGGFGWRNTELADEERKLVQRFGPQITGQLEPEGIFNDTVGFFIAKFVKLNAE